MFDVITVDAAMPPCSRTKSVCEFKWLSFKEEQLLTSPNQARQLKSRRSPCFSAQNLTAGHSGVDRLGTSEKSRLLETEKIFQKNSVILQTRKIFRKSIVKKSSIWVKHQLFIEFSPRNSKNSLKFSKSSFIFVSNAQNYVARVVQKGLLLAQFFYQL